MLGLGLSISSEDSSTNRITLLVSAFGARLVEDSGTIENPSCMQQDLADLVAEAAPFTTGLLEFYPGAAAAYSLRQLRRSVFPYAIRVRRSSDDTEQDIGFNSNGELDTNALLDFAGTGDAHVSKWYDQSSNGNDATQGTNAAQPQIVSSGSVVTENGKPAVDFDGSNDTFDITGLTNSVSDYSLFAVVKNSSSGSYSDYLFDCLGTDRFIIDSRSSSFPGVYYDGGFRGTGFTHTTQAITSIHMVSPNSGSSYLNGTSTNTGLPYSQRPINGAVALGSRYDGAAIHWDGNMQEIVLYASDKTSNRTGIETNINDYYNIY